MHQQEGPFGVQPEQRGSEILATFRLAGVGGAIKGILNERSLLLERRDGKGLRVDIDTIRRVRHHHTPMIPQGLTWMGIITLILAARVLSGSIQIYALFLGASTIFAWIIGRKPTLCIDTKQGDRHMLHGPDSLLLRTQMMINRLCEGKTMEEAREGLDEMQINPNYPSISPLEAVKVESAAIQAEQTEDALLLPEIGVFDEADLEQALKAMYHGGAGEIPEPIPAETQPATQIQPATESFSTESPADHAGRGLLDRARNSLHEVRSESDEWQQQNLDGWSRPWEQPATETPVTQTDTDSAYERAWGRGEPQWYSEKDAVPGTRIQTALSEAKEEGGMFFSGSMFDDPEPSQTTDTGIFGNMFDAPTSTPSHQPIAQPEQAPTWSGQAIRNAAPTSSALATTLPEPTLHALREECTPGVVAAARIAIPEETLSQTQTTEAQNLEEFPAFGALLRNSPNRRLRSSAAPKQGRFAKLVKGGFNALIRKQSKTPTRKMVRPVKIEGDNYAEIYGDDDGFGDGEYREVALRSGQILRLRADQDHQAEVAERIRTLSKSTGGSLADDETDALIERLSASGDLEPIADLLKAVDTKQLSFGQLASTSPPKEAPGHHGISRLG